MYPREGECPRKDKLKRGPDLQGQGSDLVDDVVAAYQMTEKLAGWPETDTVPGPWASRG